MLDGSPLLAVEIGPTTHLGEFASEIAEFQFGDINADGFLDLVVVRTSSAGSQSSLMASQTASGDSPAPAEDVPASTAGDNLGQTSETNRYAVVVEAYIFHPDGDRFERRQLGSPYQVDDAIHALHLSDFDGDGWVDVLLQSGITGRILYAPLNESAREQSLSNTGRAIASVDWNLDGKLDLISNWKGDTAVFTQTAYAQEIANDAQSDSQFELTATIPGHFVGTLDVEQDGDLDILSLCRDSCSTPNQIVVHHNHRGTFTQLERRINFHVETELAAESFVLAQVVDLDADGTKELVTVADGSTGAQLTTWRPGASGLNQVAQYDLSVLPEDIVLGDFNDDGLQDIFLPGAESTSDLNLANGFAPLLLTQNDLSFLRYDLPTLAATDQAMQSGEILAYDVGQHAITRIRESIRPEFDTYHRYPTSVDGRSAQVVDLNADGKLDIVGRTPEGLEVLVAESEGTYSTHEVSLPIAETFQFYVEAFEQRDSLSVTVVGAHSEDQTAIYRIRVDQEGVHLSQPYVTDQGIVLEVVDLDADGLTDFVFRSDFLAEAKRSFVVLNRGDTWITSTLSDQAATIAVEDLNNDGTLEAYVFDDPIRIFRYHNDRFEPFGTVPKGTTRARVTDVNDDGLLDFVSSHKRSNRGTTLSVFTNNGDGTWHAWDDVAANSHQLVDVNADGLLDIASPRLFYLSNGDGTWSTSQPIRSTTPEWTERDQYVDFNGDGWIDVAKYHATTGLLSLHALTEELSWSVVNLEQVVRGLRFELIDLNDDQLLDLVDTNGSQTQVLMRHVDGWSPPQLLSKDNTTYAVTQREGFVQLSVVDGQELVVYAMDEFGVFQSTSRRELGDFFLQDVNEDGALDLRLGDGRVMMQHAGQFSNPAEANMVPPTTKWLGTTLRHVAGDGKSADRKSLTRYYATSVNHTHESDMSKSLFADLDNDGDQDFLVFHPDGMLVMSGNEWTPGVEGDFDGDQAVGVADLDLLHRALRSERLDHQVEMTHLDVNRDGVLDWADSDYWREQIAQVQLGDADFNGKVDFSDFLTFSIHFGKTNASWADGDFDGNGTVSFPDFLMLTRNYGFD